MNVSDVIAGVGAAVAVVALVTSYLVSRKQAALQQTQTTESLDEDKSKAIHDLQLALAKLGDNPSGWGYIGPEVQGLAERAAALVQHPGVEAYWSDYVILGYAFAQVWDMDSAGSYWEMAVQHAATPASLLNALRGRAEYRFAVGAIAHGERDFERAVELLTNKPPTDVDTEQIVMLYAQQASLEFSVAAAQPVIDDLLVKACASWASLTAAWRSTRSAAWLVRTAMQVGCEPSRLGLPPEIVQQAMMNGPAQLPRNLLGAPTTSVFAPRAADNTPV